MILTQNRLALPLTILTLTDKYLKQDVGEDSTLRHTTKNKLQSIFNISSLINYKTTYLCNDSDYILWSIKTS